MSKRAKSQHLRSLALLAASVPLMGIGYIAGEHGTLRSFHGFIQTHFSEHLSPGMARYLSGGSRVVVAVETPEEKAKRFFASKEKGPRFDRVDFASSVSVAERKPRQMVAAISPYGANLSNAPVKNEGVAPTINRARKFAKLQVSDVVAARTTEADATVAEADENVEEIITSSVRFASARVFFDNPFRKKHDQFVTLSEVDRAQMMFAALSDPTNAEPKTGGPISGIGRKLYYGAMMSSDQRQKEKICLAKAIYFESRGEPVKGQLAVAQVVMNRVRENYYPDTVCGVVFENAHRRNKCQFSFACDGIPDVPKDKRLWELAQKLSGKTLNGEVWLTDIGHASHYHATYVKPKWRRYMRRIKRIGVHIFYRGKFLPKVVASNNT